LHNTTTIIRAYSNVPGLQCNKCSKSGYPATTGAVVPGPQATWMLPKNEVVSLRVKDPTGYEMEVKMVNTVPFSYLMDTYATQVHRDRDDVRFFMDGELIVEDETPKKASKLLCESASCAHPANMSDSTISQTETRLMCSGRKREVVRIAARSNARSGRDVSEG